MRPFLCSYQVRHLDWLTVDFSKKSASSCVTLILFSARVQACSRSGVDSALFFGSYRSVNGCGKLGSAAAVLDNLARAVLDDSAIVAVVDDAATVVVLDDSEMVAVFDDVATVAVDVDLATLEILEVVG